MKTFLIYFKTTSPTLPNPMQVKGEHLIDSKDEILIRGDANKDKAMFRKAEIIGWEEQETS